MAEEQTIEINEVLDIDKNMTIDEALKYSTYRLYEMAIILKEHEGTEKAVSDILNMAIAFKNIANEIDDLQSASCNHKIDTLNDTQHDVILSKIQSVEIT